MKFRLLIVAAFLLSFCLISVAYGQRNKAYKQLFNGRNLAGWSVIGGAGTVNVESGMIVLHMAANTQEHTFVRTNKQYGDFILEVEIKRDQGFYYGILFRAQDAPDTADVRLFGYQVKADHNPKRRWTGGIFDDFGTSWNWMYSLEQDVRAQEAVHPAGEWDHYRIEAIGSHIKVWLNGVPTTNLINEKYNKGYVAFKIHFLGDQPEKEQAAGYIKNVRIFTRNVSKYAQLMGIPSKKAP